MCFRLSSGKLKNINMQPIQLVKLTFFSKSLPPPPPNIAPHYHEMKSKLILKSGKLERLIGLNLHQDGFKTSNSHEIKLTSR